MGELGRDGEGMIIEHGVMGEEMIRVIHEDENIRLI